MYMQVMYNPIQRELKHSSYISLVMEGHQYLLYMSYLFRSGQMQERCVAMI